MVEFLYTATDENSASLMPRLSLTLARVNRKVDVVGLLDTGAAVNVLPYYLGIALGANWEEQTTSVALVGSLGRFEARALVLNALHPQIIPNESVQLVFAWTRSENAPLIFGQMNFFLEFDVCFFRAQGIFEVQRKAQPV